LTNHELGSRVISLEPAGRQTLQELLLKIGFNSAGECGGRGRCGKCRVEIIEAGEVRTVLACQFIPKRPVRVLVGEMTNEQLRKYPKMNDQLENWVLGNWRIGKCPGNLNLVADIGTTTIALAAVDRERRRIAFSQTVLNPQIRFGSDVMIRISRQRLVRRVRITDLLLRFIRANGLDRRRRITVVGNTAMMHFLFGENPSSLGVYPYHSRLPLKTVLKRRLNGLLLESLPLLGSFLGSDCTAAILAAGLDRKSIRTLLIDAGTNGEVVLGNRERIIACSTAAGPAFEGATLSCGSLALPGAIHSCRFCDGNWRIKTIGALEPIGLCGSGVLDAVAEGVRAGLILRTGRLKDGDRLEIYRKGSNSIYLTQADIREVQLAKAAIAAGIKVLIQEWSEQTPNFKFFGRVFITGRFGGRLNPQTAFSIGLLPKLPRRFIHQHPDLALTGAFKTVYLDQKDRLNHIACLTREILLSEHPDFERFFISSMELAPWQ
jgi:uncharacterized 2Fe-2S/4Fe-4S cluster protein (DUF4445 family)